MDFLKIVTILAVCLGSSGLLASDNGRDLDMPGKRWVAKFNGYKCRAFESTVNRPASHSEFKVDFKKLYTDKSLDNGLLKATFHEDGVTCRYSAILFADNDASTVKLVESKAYPVNGNASCAEGKAMLDDQLLFNEYRYYGHPHHLMIVAPDSTADQVCEDDTTHIGVDFVVSGFLGDR